MKKWVGNWCASELKVQLLYSSKHGIFTFNGHLSCISAPMMHYKQVKSLKVAFKNILNLVCDTDFAQLADIKDFRH